MLKSKRTILGVVLCALTAVCVSLSITSFGKTETCYATTSGSCGSGVYWELKNGNTLRIWGNGEMDNYEDYDETPWYEAEVYYDDENITKIVIDDGVTKIGNYAFAYFYYINEIQIGQDVKSIGEYAFYKVGKYQSSTIQLRFPSGLKDYGNYSFYCANIGEQLTFPTYTSHIGDYAFSETNITAVYISEPSNNDTFWGIYSFYYCPKLVDVTFEKGVTKVGYGAFYRCYALQCIEFPDTMQKIEHAAFGYDSSIGKIFYKGTGFLNNVTCDSYNDYINKYKTYQLNENWTPKYVDKDGKTIYCNNRKMYKIVTPDCELTDGIWIVRGNINLGNYSLEIVGNATLVLVDNCGITTSGGINVHSGCTFTIASEQVENIDTMGRIIVPSVPEKYAGIGGRNDVDNYSIVICGGNIEAHGGCFGSGIGSGSDGKSTVTIYNGNIIAFGGERGAGIGSGDDSDSIVTVNGGNIRANGGKYSAGIGSGNYANSTVTVNGGNIRVDGGNNGAGIGSGTNGSSTITINDGEINAHGGNLSAGIGSGKYGNSTITINGGNIIAFGGQYGAGIGSGFTGVDSISNSIIDLYGGNIVAIGSDEAEDIGKGYNSLATVNDYRTKTDDVNVVGTLMSSDSLTILFGILAGVFLVTTAVFMTLYFRKKKSFKF